MNNFIQFALANRLTISFEQDGALVAIIVRNAKSQARLSYDPSLGDLWNAGRLQSQWNQVQAQFE